MNQMKINELRKLTTEEMLKKIDDCKEELFNLRLKQATGSLENAGRIHELRKTVARLKTILNEKKIKG